MPRIPTPSSARRLAVEYRYKFGSDVVLDLIGFRRHGHSEVDDPTITQPVLYARSRPIRHFGNLRAHTKIDPALAAEIRAEFEAALEAARTMRKKSQAAPIARYWDAFHGGPYDPMRSGYRVPPDELKPIADAWCAIPGLSHPSQGQEVDRPARADGVRQTSRSITAQRKCWPMDRSCGWDAGST